MIPAELFAAVKAATPTASALAVPFPLRDGGTFSLGAERGHPVLLSFWASWCAPCRRELPALAKWATAHPEVKIIAVNVDRTRPEADRFLTAVSFDLPVAFDPDARVLGAYGAISMPTMFLFDGQGELVWRHAGYSEQKGFTELEAALGGVR
jgi:thiol-disulfide isomerase/thioredoxin